VCCETCRTVADFFFAEEAAALRCGRADSEKADAALAKRVFGARARGVGDGGVTHDGLEAALRAAAEGLGIKAGQMFEPIRVGGVRSQDGASIVRHAGGVLGQRRHDSGAHRRSDREVGGRVGLQARAGRPRPAEGPTWTSAAGSKTSPPSGGKLRIRQWWY